MPAKSIVLVDPHSLLPNAVVGLNHPDVPFRGQGHPEIEFLDNAYGGFDSALRATLSSACGIQVRVEADESSPWLQIHTPHKNPHYQQTVVIEPMTCPPNAFNSKVDLVSLEPDCEFSTEWKIIL